jgi:hypothetical protein
MPTIVEPIGAGLAVALINKSLWLFLCPEVVEKEDYEHECTSSNTTSINDVEVHMHH